MTKIGFFSDIHGNFEALTAILERLDQEACDYLICLGDIVGYGASPAQCVQLIRQREIPCTLGNHDHYATLLMDPAIDRLRDDVKHSITWTQSQLSMDDLKWLSSLPKFVQADDDFTALHASFAPGRWGYCMDAESIAANFTGQSCQLAFCGHSHSPLLGIEVAGATPRVEPISNGFVVPSDTKVVVNVGSVGQPRDCDSRACACIYELESRRLELIRQEYDIRKAQRKIYAAGLPEKFGIRLDAGK